MKKTASLTKDDVIRFVRGEKPWNMLKSPDIRIEFVDKKVQAKSSGKPVAAPQLPDIAQGFSRFRDDPESLREWAAVMLALLEIDLDALENNPDGEALKEALWDASFSEEVSDTTWNLIARLLLSS